jgi:hypothetical protein
MGKREGSGNAPETLWVWRIRMAILESQLCQQQKKVFALVKPELRDQVRRLVRVKQLL